MSRPAPTRPPPRPRWRLQSTIAARHRHLEVARRHQCGRRRAVEPCFAGRRRWRGHHARREIVDVAHRPAARSFPRSRAPGPRAKPWTRSPARERRRRRPRTRRCVSAFEHSGSLEPRYRCGVAAERTAASACCLEVPSEDLANGNDWRAGQGIAVEGSGSKKGSPVLGTAPAEPLLVRPRHPRERRPGS